METETRNTIPLWLAVAITVVVSLPFGLWLDKWSLPLWAAFIVWAEYFLLGAKPEGLKIMVPSYILGVIGAVLVLVLTVAISKVIDVKIVASSPVPDVAYAIGFFIGFCVLIYVMKFMPVTGGAGTLPFFNGISMGLAVYFTGTYAGVFGTVDSLLVPVACGVAAILAGLLGAFLGWFNVTILFPRQVAKA